MPERHDRPSAHARSGPRTPWSSAGTPLSCSAISPATRRFRNGWTWRISGTSKRATSAWPAGIIERWGGFVASFQGDGVLAFFGYPSAHETDAERAIRAGLELVGARARPFRRAERRRRPVARPLVRPGRPAHRSGDDLTGPRRFRHGRPRRGRRGRQPRRAPASGRPARGGAGEPRNPGTGGRPLRHRAARPEGDPRPFPRRVRAPRPARPAVGGPGLEPCPPRRHAPRGPRPAAARIAAPLARGGAREATFRVVHVARRGGGRQDAAGGGALRPGRRPSEASAVQASCLEIFSNTPLYPAASLLWSRSGLTAEDGAARARAKILRFLSAFGRKATPEEVEVAAGLLGIARNGAGRGRRSALAPHQAEAVRPADLAPGARHGRPADAALGGGRPLARPLLGGAARLPGRALRGPSRSCWC